VTLVYGDYGCKTGWDGENCTLIAPQLTPSQVQTIQDISNAMVITLVVAPAATAGVSSCCWGLCSTKSFNLPLVPSSLITTLLSSPVVLMQRYYIESDSVPSVVVPSLHGQSGVCQHRESDMGDSPPCVRVTSDHQQHSQGREHEQSHHIRVLHHL